MIISKYTIPGWINNNQCNQITKLISTLPDNARILEVGAAFGKSTLSILEGMKSSQTLDICDLWDAQQFWDMMNNNEHRATLYGEQENIDYAADVILSRKLEIRQLWNEHVSTSPNYNLIRNVYQQQSLTLANTTDYDIVFLDGDHSYENLYNELNLFNDIPIICGDDYGYHEPGVVKAVTQYGNSNHRTLTVDLNSFFYILRRGDLNDFL
jgi:hypothetical protein